jgi:hypothetical protein
VDGSSESSAVLVVIRLGSSAAAMARLGSSWRNGRWSLESSELNGGRRLEMEEPVAVVAGGRRCSAGRWGGGREEMEQIIFFREIEMTLGLWDDLKILREGEEREGKSADRGEEVCV